MAHMARYWLADATFFELLRDREVLTRIVAEVAGETVAAANAGEKTKTMKRIVADHLDGRDGRTKVENWVPRWMTFPPSGYTARGGVGTVAAHAKAEAAREIERDAKVEGGDDDQPDPAAPATVAVLPDDEDAPDSDAEPLPLAA